MTNTASLRARWVCLLALAVFVPPGMRAVDEVAPPPKDPTKVKLPEPYANRAGDAREKAIKDSGGNKASEDAVARGLLWLALHQAPDGHWSLDEFSKHSRTKLDDKETFDDKSTGKGTKNDTAGTAFGLLPFLGAGITHKPSGKENEDRFVKTVRNGLSYLMQKQGKDGAFPGGLYAHPIATMALCEAYGLTGDPMLKKPAQAAINYIIAAQDPQGGGWRYQPRQGSDTSVTGWHMQALFSARAAGLNVPKKTLDGAVKWLNSCETPDGGGYGYTGPVETPTLTAVGLLCRVYLGTPPRNANLRNGLEKLKKNAPPGAVRNAYGEFYATQLFHHMGGDDWTFWNTGNQKNKGIREVMLERQDRDGSWNPQGEPFGQAGGRIMQTSLSLLMLEVYYRHAPLFRRIGQD